MFVSTAKKIALRYLRASTVDGQPRLQRLPPDGTAFIKAWPEVEATVPLAFVKTVAHEIRNPLTNIRLSLELLSDKEATVEKNKYLRIIQRAYDRIHSLVDELCRYIPLDKDSHVCCSAGALVEEALVNVRDRAQIKGISLQTDLLAGECVLGVSLDEMTVALTNILINAAESIVTEAGVIKLAIMRSGDSCVIEIGDNGCGMDAKQLQSLFEPFVTGKPEGLGMGMANTRAILDRNHVSVSVRSAPDSGTCFTLTFPLLRVIRYNRF